MNPDNNSEFVEFDPVLWIRQTLAILWKRKKLIVGFFTVSMTLVVIGLIICPRAYLSDSKLFVRVGRESVALDPTATTGQTLQLHQTRESEISSVMDLLDTRGLYEQVVDRIGEEIILDDKPFDEQIWLNSRQSVDMVKKHTHGEPLPTTTKKREKAVKELLGSISQEREENSSVISIASTASSPELARAILIEYVDVFRNHHSEANRTDGSYTFFEEQTSEIRQQHKEASGKLREIRTKLGAVSIYSRRESIQKQIDLLEQERLTATTSLKASNAMIKSLIIAIKGLPEQSIAESVTGLPDDAVGTIRKELSLLTIREAELTARFTENYPSVIAVRRRREEAENVLKSTINTPSQIKHAVNPAWQEVSIKLLYEKTNASSLDAKIVAINSSLDDIRMQLMALNTQEAGMVDLEQNIELLRDKLGNYAERIEESRIEQAMANSGISNVNVVQHPSLILKPASPQKAIILIIGFMFSCFGAVSLAFLKEMFEASARLPSAPSQSASSANSPSHHYAQGQDPLQTIASTSEMIMEARS